MAYGETKIYNDGSHYIAIPKTSRPMKKGSSKSKEDNVIKEKADMVYAEVKGKRKEKAEEMVKELGNFFNSESETREYVESYIEKKNRNLIERRKRLARKINLGRWNYFCTFTYDDKLHNEESFKKKLKNCLKKLSHRKGWIYIGVWERSPEKKRLHFHGVFYIPDGTMVGELIEVNDYSFNAHKRQTTTQNTYFKKGLGVVILAL